MSAEPFRVDQLEQWEVMVHKGGGSTCLHLSSGPEYEEVEVHLLREKTGFGFRILGGDEAVQAVSPDARDKARMGRAGPHTFNLIHTNTHLTCT